MTVAVDPVGQYRTAHARFQAAKSPSWLRDIQSRAVEQFGKLGFPDQSDESWRFTSIRPITERSFALASSAARVATDDVADVLQLAPGPTLVFVNGRLSADLSRTGRTPKGLHIASLAEAIESVPDLVRAQIERWNALPQDAFTTLGTAFLRDGAFVHVQGGVRIDEPISIVYVSTDLTDQCVHPHTFLLVDREAAVTVNEVYVGVEGGGYFTNASTVATLGDGARMRHYRVQREDAKAFHVATNHWSLGRDATLESCSLAFGSALARHQLVGVLDGSNASLTLDGLSILAGDQHGDHHTVIDHAKPHCQSHEVFNGVFAGGSRGVFNGRIIVRPGAQRTDSKQTSNNLLLTDRARADTQPQLEIYADDVKCTHGATLGPLDETALFYLLSRGLDRIEARNALTYGFAAEILARVSAPEIRAHFDRYVRKALLETIGRAA